jgi:hypothetical protein
MHSTHCGRGILPYHALKGRPAQDTLTGCMGQHNKKFDGTEHSLCTNMAVMRRFVVIKDRRGMQGRILRNRTVKQVEQSHSKPRRRRGERGYRSYSFMTSTLDGVEWSASRPGRALPREKDPRYPLHTILSEPQCRSGQKG